MTKFVQRVKAQISKVDHRAELLRARLLRGQQKAITRRVAQLLIQGYNECFPKKHNRNTVNGRKS